MRNGERKRERERERERERKMDREREQGNTSFKLTKNSLTIF